MNESHNTQLMKIAHELEELEERLTAVEARMENFTPRDLTDDEIAALIKNLENHPNSILYKGEDKS